MTEQLRVLLVDDHVELAENLAEILEEAGVGCEVAGNAEDALERVLAGEFHGVITDYRLPGGSGVELIRRVRERGLCLPVILISAFAADDVIRTAEDAGALSVLPKPIDVAQLKTLLQAFKKPAKEVLLIEDDPRLAENLAELLTGRGFDVLTAEDVRCTLLQRRLPRVAVVDVNLPDGSGFQVARRLLARDPSIRILIMSGNLDADTRAQVASLPGAAPLLAKPIAPAEFLQRVGEALNQ